MAVRFESNFVNGFPFSLSGSESGMISNTTREMKNCRMWLNLSIARLLGLEPICCSSFGLPVRLG